MKKCLVAGAAMLDITLHIESLPKSGDDVYASSQKMSIGGCACNVAGILRHFNFPFTLFAPIGKGMYADIIARRLKEIGCESPIKSEKGDNGYCLCLVEKTGERTFITLPGIECGFEREWFSALNAEDYGSAYVSGYEVEGAGGEQIIQFLEEHPRLSVYYDPGPRITHIPEEKTRRLFALSPILHLNEKEAKEYAGTNDAARAAEELKSRTDAPVIVTLGGEGALICGGKSAKGEIIKAGKATPVDTTGAGDSHIAAVIALHQAGCPLEEAVRKANRVAAAVVGVHGPSITKEEFGQIGMEE